LEATTNGKEPMVLSSDVKRSFLEDGDKVIMKGFATAVVDGNNVRIGFGNCEGVVIP
jgi:fumarylacetoacetase